MHSVAWFFSECPAPADVPEGSAAQRAVVQVLARSHPALRVHPLVPHSPKPGLRDWQRLATTAAPAICTWARRFPQANRGPVAGVESRVFVLNINQRHGGETAVQTLATQGDPVLSTWQVRTADGCHLYFKHPGGQIRTGALTSSIRVLGDGHNTGGLGSRHRSSPAYVRSEGYDQERIPLATPPPFLCALLRAHALWILFCQPIASKRNHQRASQYFIQQAALDAQAGEQEQGGVA